MVDVGHGCGYQPARLAPRPPQNPTTKFVPTPPNESIRKKHSAPRISGEAGGMRYDETAVQYLDAASW